LLFQEYLQPIHGDPTLLKSEHIKKIFGNISDITHVHLPMASDLEESLHNWTEASQVGDIFYSIVYISQHSHKQTPKTKPN
jgi:hypothetical protein